MVAPFPTHFFFRLQAAANSRAFGLAKDQATILGIELDAAHASWLAMRHPGNRRRDGRRDATSAAPNAAIQVCHDDS